MRPKATSLQKSWGEMGETHITALIRNPADPDKVWGGLFLVDTGAIDCVVSRPDLESIGLRAEGQRVYTLANGSEVTMDITGARMEFMGEVVWVIVVIAEAGTEPLLGVTTLESAGIEVDRRNERVRKLPSIGLRGLGGSAR